MTLPLFGINASSAETLKRTAGTTMKVLEAQAPVRVHPAVNVVIIRVAQGPALTDHAMDRIAIKDVGVLLSTQFV